MDRGWIFVAIDHLGVGESSIHDPPKLNFTSVSAANQSAEKEISEQLRDSTLLPGYPLVSDPVKIGIGQSMGGCMTIVQQRRYHGYDGTGILGYSAIHTHPPTMPATAPLVVPWWSRDRVGQVPIRHTPLHQGSGGQQSGVEMGWGFHYDDVDPKIVAHDLSHFDRPPTDVGKTVTVDCPPWGSLTFPVHTAQLQLSPGAVAREAAAVMVSVLIIMGERDVIADPKGEGRAYQSATSIDLFVCPRMGHMHNFASTREILWRRLEIWAEWVREAKKALA